MLPWEEHAKRGMYFFSWKGGFVCTGPDPSPPDEWIDDVVTRSRFSFTKMALNDKTVYYTESIDLNGLTSNEEVNDCIKLTFSQGTIVYIGLGDLETGDKKDTSFIST